MAFKTILGHDRAVAFLRQAIASGRAGASLVFYGPEGVGRRTTALALAQALNCEEEPGEGCGECDVCIRFKGRTECLVAQGETEAMALQAARTGACARLGSGVTDSVKCGSTPPESFRCREL